MGGNRLGQHSAGERKSTSPEAGYRDAVARTWIGCSGWSYDHWVGVLYPEGLPKARWRDAYAEAFEAVELNASFYRWPGAKQFHRWGEALPDDFKMAIKASRWITHARRLSDPDNAWVLRLHDAWRGLGEHAGPVLLQLHPDHQRDDERLDDFLNRLPDELPAAVELRHPSWHVEEVFALLEQHSAAYVVMSGAKLPCLLRVTAPFVYVRLHGPSRDHLYAGSYSEHDLRWWAEQLREWLDQGRDAWVFFNNDAAGNAVRNGQRLRQLLA
jgi:uncharacterized protein YecE (DUF72 family)